MPSRELQARGLQSRRYSFAQPGKRGADFYRRHMVPRVYDNYDQLLDDQTIEILDIAVPPQYQGDLIRAACARATVKAILAQKPLALGYGEAAQPVRCCERRESCCP